MTRKNNLTKRILSAVLSIALIMTSIPLSAFTSEAATSPTNVYEKVVDAPTLDDWKALFTDDTTDAAGGVWTDKSVFKNTDDYLEATDETENYTMSMTDDNNFLVSLSSIASSKSVTGYSTTPTDTMLILDMSSSMQGSINSIEPLAEASNAAVKKLLELNNNNRVGIVLYSGADENSGTMQTRVLLPLDRYTAGTGGNYIEYRDIPTGGYRTEEGIAIVNGVRNSKNQTNFGLADNQSIWSSGTFTQDGIYVATNLLMEASKNVEEGNVQAGQERMPIMVLMSDGEPSVVSTDYAEGTLDNDDGLYHLTSAYTRGTTHTGTDTEFMVQLTAAYAKYRLEQKYKEHDLLFYSLGLQGNYGFATTILDPEGNTDTNRYWSSYLGNNYQNFSLYNETTNHRYEITTSDEIRAQLKAAVESTAAEDLRSNGSNKYRYYIDRYFEADGVQNLAGAFDAIVEEIILQSKYYPTEVEDGKDVNYDGYLTLVDTLGEHMEVKDMKHIQLGNSPFYGRNAAREMSRTETTVNLGEIAANLLEAVQIRLGLDNKEQALEVIQAAQASGLLYFRSDTDFDNAIGWYGNYSKDEEGATYIATWNGKDTSDAPANANVAIKSYYFYGAGEATQGEVRVGDMRYIAVEVVTMLDTGEIKVRLRIPASLIPLIVYNVRLAGEDLDSPVEAITMSGATAPIRLLYEVGLKDGINSLNVGTLAANAYNATTGKYEFYSNKYSYVGNEEIGKIPPREVGNSYAYFEPSAENEYLIYQYNSPIYTESGGVYTPYTGTTLPTGDTLYGSRYIYTKPATGQTTEPSLKYFEMDEHQIAVATRVDGKWVLPKGAHVLKDGSNLINYKEANTTGTYRTSSTYYIMHDKVGDTPIYNMEVALGNNGKLSLEALQGIRLQKLVPAHSGLGEAEEYEFTITAATGTTALVVGAEYDLYTVNAIDNDGTAGAGTPVQIAVDSSNALTVKLGANQTAYIEGLAAGDYVVTEKIGDSYVVSEINGATSSTNSTTVTVADRVFTTTSFTNIARGAGNLTVSKEITHPFGTGYQIPNDLQNVPSFNMTVTLTFNGAPLVSKEYTARQTKNNAITKINTDANGQFTITLANEDQIEVFDLPEGTIAKVVENLGTGAAYTPAYWNEGALSNEKFGEVTVAAGVTRDILVVNDYKPNQVASPIIELVVNKTLTGRTWSAADEFAFELQKWNGTAWETIHLQKKILGSAASGTNNVLQLDFTNEIKNESYSEIGTYYYRVIEIEPTPHGILGVSYDKALHGFTVKVTDKDMDGALEVDVVSRASTTLEEKVDVAKDANEKYTVTTNFENIFAVNDTNAAIEIHKNVINDSKSPFATLNGFGFEIYESDAEGVFHAVLNDAYQPAETTTTGTTRTTIHYTQADLNGGTERIFYYGIKEKRGTTAGWSYSEEVKYVTVVLTTESEQGSADAKLVATVYEGLGATGEGSSTATVSFTNTYSPRPVTMAIGFADKELSGRNLKAGEFTFELTAVNTASQNINFAVSSTPVVAGQALPATSTVASISGSNDVSGSDKTKGTVTFDKYLYFDEVGEYFFNLVEVEPTETNGVTYDKTIHRIVVTVTDNNGELSADYRVIDVPDNTVIFKNSYTPEDVKYTVKGTKTLTGRNLRDQEFTFVLTEALDALGTPKLGAASYYAKNNVDVTDAHKGTFTFQELSYDAAGEYYYVLKEQKGAENIGMTYDETPRVVTVTVSYDADTGKFNASSNIDTTPIVIENEYEAAATTANIAGSKTLIGNRKMDAGEFSFELYKANASFTPEQNVFKTAKNNANRQFVFEDIPFETAGKHYFVVKEYEPDNQDKIAGVSYDDRIYHVTVEVTDNGMGKLTAGTPTITMVTDEGELPATAIAFYNSYKAERTKLAISGTKELTGRDMIDNEFEFVLTEAIDSNGTIAEGALSYYAKNDVSSSNSKKGTFTFPEIPYEDVGEYYYVITEKKLADDNGITYDEKQYVVTVTVTDDPVKAELVAKADLDTGEIVFKNVYKEPKVEFVKEQYINDKLASHDSTVKAGDVVTYKMTVKNTGGDAAMDIVIADHVPAGLKLVEGSITGNGVQGQDGLIKWDIAKLKAGESISVSFQASVPEVTKDTVWSNVATMNYENNPDNPTPDDPKEVPSNKVEVEITVKTEAPKTGDATSVVPTLVMMILSAGYVLIACAKRKKED